MDKKKFIIILAVCVVSVVFLYIRKNKQEISVNIDTDTVITDVKEITWLRYLNNLLDLFELKPELDEDRVTIVNESGCEKSEKDNTILLQSCCNIMFKEKEIDNSNWWQYVLNKFNPEFQQVEVTFPKDFRVMVKVCNKGTVARKDFQSDNLISTLSNKEIIKNIDSDPNRFYFDDCIKCESQLKKRLNQIRVVEIEHVLAIWRKSHKGSNCGDCDASENKNTMFVTYMPKEEIDHLKIKFLENEGDTVKLNVSDKGGELSIKYPDCEEKKLKVEINKGTITFQPVEM